MSEPEIARRCSACGISVRQSALYCPQCGHTVGDGSISEHSPAPVPAKAGVAENVRERVEKIKHVSSVMIDQAAYDPSLRFLLVAAVLFILFLLLLILSKVIG
jgi:endogenous inhibitor of DNA gyrase (YacG/DUF329 family)